jgi:galactose mutarotase-like enzyme
MAFRVPFLSLGGIITEIDMPDRTGRLDDIALGLKTLQEYETLPGHFGAITGRYANRIGGAQFTLNGQTYYLIANNGANTLHGGPNALDRQVWTVSPAPAPDGVAATLSYVSKDGDQNFPGTLTTYVTYTLTNDNALRIDYVASTDKVQYQLHQPFLLQSGRQRLWFGRRSTAAGQCRPLHPRRARSDPHRRDRTSRRHTARLPADDADRRPAAQRVPADGLCAWLRPQFRAEPTPRRQHRNLSMLVSASERCHNRTWRSKQGG